MELIIAIFIQPFIDMADDPVLFIQVIWEGLVTGILYSLIAFGFVLIFKASGVFNFAQGVFALFAALTLVGFQTGQVPFSHLINELLKPQVYLILPRESWLCLLHLL